MDGLIERERAHEAKFEHDQLLDFKIIARRNRLFGIWVADLLGMTQTQAEIYARTLSTVDFCIPKGHEVIEKVQKDLQDLRIDVSSNRLYKQLKYFYREAATQIIKE